MKTLAFARDLGSNALDFGSNALDLGWERRKTVLAVVGGVALVAVAGVIVTRLLRKRAAAPTQADIDLPAAKHAAPKHSKHGAGSSATIAKAAKL